MVTNVPPGALDKKNDNYFSHFIEKESNIFLKICPKRKISAAEKIESEHKIIYSTP
jgi:hypothetical protein